MKVRRFPVTAALLVDMCKGKRDIHLRITENPLPADAEIVGMGHDPLGWINLLLRSETFEDVDPSNGDIPVQPAPVFTHLRIP